jgi:hypothetical protein
MPFKIKDLMINDLSQPPLPIQFRTCNPVTRGGADWINTTPIQDMGDPAEFQASLAILKEQLRGQLAGVEKLEAALEKGFLPESVGETDALMAKLTDALEVLRVHRATFAGD